MTDYKDNSQEKRKVNERIKRASYQTAKKLYNSNTVPPHKGIPFDYGSSLRRVIDIYQISFEELFAIFKIPRTFISKILKNELVPTEELILNILHFLQNLPISDDYEKEFVEEAISVYEGLKEMHLKGDSLSFTLCLEEESKYLALWKDFDSSVLEKVKECKYDWYLKCLTIYSIIYKERKIPTSAMQYYFYDGSFISKWLPTQKRFLEGNGGTLSQEQVFMLKHVYDLLECIEYEYKCKKDVKVILSTSFESVCQSFAEAIKEHGDIPQDVYYEKVLLRTLWHYLEEQLKEKKLPYTNKQILQIKELRHKVIFHKKNKNKTKGKGEIDFGYELACFMDGLNLNFPKAASMFEVSVPAMAHYSCNYNLPSGEIINKILSSLNQLDLSSYRKDQIQDIEQFKKILSSLQNKDSLVDLTEVDLTQLFPPMDTTLLTGQVLKDVSLTYLKEVYATNLSWYQEFKKIYKFIFLSLIDENVSLVVLKKKEWFILESYKCFKGKSTAAKGELLRYLYYLCQKVILKRKETCFVRNFITLENFIYDNKRIPFLGELSLLKNQDGRNFYSKIRASLYGTNDYYQDLPAYLQEQMKLIIQYVTLCHREKYNYRKDRIEEGELFLGERITAIRICLGLSRDAFVKRIGWTNNEMFAIYSNRNSFTEGQIQEILHLLKEMKSEKLRKDQLEEIQDLILVLTTKQLDNAFYLKFCPKNKENL